MDKVKRLEKYEFESLVTCDDYWFLPIDGTHVTCHVGILKDGQTLYVSFWGDDDFGMFKETDYQNKAEAKTQFRKFARSRLREQFFTCS